MKKVLFDNNIILDVLLKRKALYEASALSLSFAEKKQITGFICAIAVPFIFYLVEKEKSKKDARKLFENLLKIVHMATVDDRVIKSALKSGYNDFEDAIIYFSALYSKVNFILTRNKKDFKNSVLPILSPEELVIRLMRKTNLSNL